MHREGLWATLETLKEWGDVVRFAFRAGAEGYHCRTVGHYIDMFSMCP